jgi:hypothetical protein
MWRARMRLSVRPQSDDIGRASGPACRFGVEPSGARAGDRAGTRSPEHDGRMTVDDQELLPAWVLRTPVRSWEWWLHPLLLLLLGAGVGVASVVLTSSERVHVAGIVAAASVASGAVVLGVAARHAYEAQEIGASWRFHVTAVLVGLGASTVIVLAGLVAGIGGLASYGMVALVVARQSGVPELRFDVLARIVTAAVLGSAFVVAAVIGALDPGLSRVVATLSVASLVLVPVVLLSIVVDLRRLRTARVR